MILVVASNSNTCRFYHYSKHPAQLTLIKEIYHPENKLKNGDLASDKSGHYKGDEGGRGSYSPHMDIKDVQIDNFSREVAKILDHERNENEYEKLIIIAPPHISGLLNGHLNKHVKELICNYIHKDLLHLSEQELLHFLQENTKFVTMK